MKNNIKMMLKDAASRQEISNLQEQILNNVDITKIERKPKSVALPKRKFNFFPLILGGIATIALVITLSITVGVLNGNKSDTNVIPTVVPTPTEFPTDHTIPTDHDIPTKTEEPVVYEELSMTELEQFYSTFTVNDAPNMINIVNTFNNISYDVVDGRVVDNNKNLKPDMEQAIVNDVNPYIYNIEDMLNLSSSTTTNLKLNNNQDYDYKYVIEVNNSNYNYFIYYDEILTEEKNVEKSNYKYKANLEGLVVSNGNEYLFTGEKRIKNSKLIYTTIITLDNSENVKVDETFTINQDFTVNYDKFEYKYLYTKNDLTKSIEIIQNYKNNEINNLRFVANRSEMNEFKMTITTKPDSYLNCSIDGRNSEVLSISKDNNEYVYTFKNSNNEYKK